MRGNWNDLPPDLSARILTLLVGGERAVFTSVCRAWRLSLSYTALITPSPPRPLPSNFNPKQIVPRFPWRMNFFRIAEDSFKCDLFHYFNIHDSYEIHREIPNATVRFAKLGNLLMLRPDNQPGFHRVFLFDPLTKIKIYIPPLINHLQPQPPTVMYFAYSPNSEDVYVIGYDSIVSDHSIESSDHSIQSDVIFSSYKFGDGHWKLYMLTAENYDFRPSNCIPAVFRGWHYCLGINGDTLIYRPDDDLDSTVTICEKTVDSDIANSMAKSFLVAKSAKQLLAIVITKEEAIHVLEWDRKKDIFRRIESVGDYMIFISDAGCFSQKATVKGTGNKIYFATHSDKAQTFYCIRTAKFYSFLNGNDISPPDLLEENRNCFWVQP